MAKRKTRTWTLTLAWLVAVVVVVPLPAQSLGSWQVETGRARRLHLGMSFERGRVASGAALIFRYRGKQIVFTPKALATWPDDSLRRARVNLPLKGRSDGFRLSCRLSKKVPSRSRRLWTLLQGTDGSASVRSSKFSLTIPADSGLIVRDLIAVNSVTLIKKMAMGASVGETEVRQVEASADYLVLEQEGRMSVEGGAGIFGIRRRYEIDFRAEELLIRQEFACDGEPVLTQDLRACVEFGFRPRTLRSAGTPKMKVKSGDAAVFSGHFSGGCRLQVGSIDQRSDAAVLRVQGLRASQRLDLGARDFEMSDRGQWLLTPDRILEISCVGQDFPWRPGRRYVQTMRWRWGKGARGRPRPFAEAIALNLRPRTIAEKGRSSSGPWREEIRSYLRRRFRPSPPRLHPFDWPGESRKGDWPWSRSHAGNLEFDTIMGMLSWADHEADPQMMRRALRAARHLIHIDIDREETQLPFRHGFDHRGPVELGHCWLEGLQALSDRAGDADLLAGADSFRQALRAAWRGRNPQTLNLRSFAWSLLNLAVLVKRSHQPADEALLDRYLDSFVALGARPWPSLDRTTKPSKAWLVSTWVAAGILGEALAQADTKKRNPDAANRWVAFMGRALELAWNSRDKTLSRSLLIPIAADAAKALPSKATCHGEQMLFFAWGLECAVDLGGPSIWRTRASEIAAAAMELLRADEKSYCGMEFSQLLWLCAR